MTTIPDPLTGPFMTSRRITDSSKMSGYAKRAADVPSGGGTVAWTLARLGYTRDDEKEQH